MLGGLYPRLRRDSASSNLVQSRRVRVVRNPGPETSPPRFQKFDNSPDKRLRTTALVCQLRANRRRVYLSRLKHPAPPIRLASFITASSDSFAYRCVVVMLAWPRTCCSAASE